MEYGCIGEVLKHSFSAELHALLADYQYELKEIPKENLDEFMRCHNFKGINVTIPYKKAVIPYLSEVSEKAAEIGAVNTVINKNGKLIGYNTDFYGMRSLIKRTNIDLFGKKVLILGSGGTSRTASAVAKDLCAKEIIIVSRTGNGGVTYEQAYKLHSDGDIIINTTPVGMYPKLNGMPIDISRFENLSGVIDAVYNPLNTKLVLTAKNAGIKASGGLYMLVAQAAAAAELFAEKEISQEKTVSVYKNILAKKQNIVLIGMPSSGKTTIGKELAKRLNKQFIDTDAEIEKNEGKTISEIFESNGEAYFRLLERETIKKVSALGNTVIATGGGVIKDYNNIFALKQNGVIVFIDRQQSQLIPTSDRPLSANGNDLKRLYSERYPLYLKYSDISVKTGNDVIKNTNAILKEL